MRKVKSVHYSETIFIPAKEKFEGDLPYWKIIGQINGSNRNDTSIIEIVLMNCKKKEDVSSKFEDEIKLTESKIQENPEKEDVYKKEIEHLKKLVKKLDPDSIYVKEPPKELIKFLNKKGFTHLKSKDVIFVSGVRDMHVEEK